MKIGIIFGGRSREREVSFAGGRTVYDCLDKNLFEPVPVFIDSLGKAIILDWQYLYKGTIRDFYPPVKFIPQDKHAFQVYIENLENLSLDVHEAIRNHCGIAVTFEELAEKIDFAFLTLHGPYGEDGTIQGILQYHNIPFTSAGIFPSAFGMDKSLQKQWMPALGFPSPSSYTLSRADWINNDPALIFENIKAETGLPFVIKSATQGSSIGVSVQKDKNIEAFAKKVDQSFFRTTITAENWSQKDTSAKLKTIRRINDLDTGIGMPVMINEKHTIRHPASLLEFLEDHFANSRDSLLLESFQTENRVVFESFINGREFSCIVIQQEDGTPFALPPTEILKKTDVFDYQAKYLPGISRKVTPIDLPEKQTEAIRTECSRLFTIMQSNVYARIDGFITGDGTIYLNDPNTTSGMLPSSFFFHQAAEPGLNPTQFLSYIIHQSLLERKKSFPVRSENLESHLQNLNQQLNPAGQTKQKKLRVAVLLGGYSTERHISVESGRNVVEKLNATPAYEPFPVFLDKVGDELLLYRIPVNLLLKDNADDIRDKIRNFKISPLSWEIIEEGKPILERFGTRNYDFYPRKLTFSELKEKADFAFLALHGRPGEDGTIQQELEKYGIPYNGSSPESAALTIDKYKTNNLLREKGFLVPGNLLITRSSWENDPEQCIKEAEKLSGFPCIAKPSDDGCSSAVIKINSPEQLKIYADASFRGNSSMSDKDRTTLGVDPTEAFPARDRFMVEELVSPKDADHFIEITGGMLTHFNASGERTYEIFEPSEALAEEGILSLAEKFLAGEGQNITPARFSFNEQKNREVSDFVRNILKSVAEALMIEGYCRIDAFVRIYENKHPEVIIIEANSLPGLTPATCIFHQAAINGYKPSAFLDKIIEYGLSKETSISNT